MKKIEHHPFATAINFLRVSDGTAADPFRCFPPPQQINQDALEEPPRPFQHRYGDDKGHSVKTEQSPTSLNTNNK